MALNADDRGRPAERYRRMAVPFPAWRTGAPQVVQSPVFRKAFAADVQAPPGPTTDCIFQREAMERAISAGSGRPRLTIDSTVASVNRT